MIPLSLNLRYSEQAQRPPAAWLMPANDWNVWFQEWSRWSIPMAQWRIALLPSGGALVLLPEGLQPAVSPHALPIGKFSARLYLDCHSRLTPAITPEEFEALLPPQAAIAIFLPQHGLQLLEAHQLVRVSDLLQSPPDSRGDWSAAQPGVALNDRLWSVEPTHILTMESIIAEGRGDIGEASDQRDALPPRPHEPGDGALDRMGRSITQAIAGGASWLVNQLRSMAGGDSSKPKQAGSSAPDAKPAKSTPAGNSWLNSMAQWAQQKMQGVSDQLDALRNRELLRLMHLLENNPDEGLRYALPLNARNDHRGLAPPGARLGPRDVNFRLGMYGGGQAADPWDISHEHRLKLTQRYRELANRELQLGRHRRAAYIFAELLGDHHSAAAALKAGKHWREAAVVYRDQLNQTRAAAECLELGGLLEEAILLYRQLAEFEKAGDLYQRLELRDQAIAAWTEAAQRQEARSNFLGAAAIYNVKIQSEPDFVAALERGWPESGQAKECLTRLLSHYGATGRHGIARNKIDRLLAPSLRSDHALLAAESLGETALAYPDQTTSLLAADHARCLAARHLPQVAKSHRERFTRVIERLVPEDSLLRHDCGRYLQSFREPIAPAKKIDQRHAGRSPELVKKFQLSRPSDFQWYAAVGNESYFFVLGKSAEEYVLLRGLWNGNTQLCSGRLQEMKTFMPMPALHPFGNGPLVIASQMWHESPHEQLWHFPQDARFPVSPIHWPVIFKDAQTFLCAVTYSNRVLQTIKYHHATAELVAESHAVLNGRKIGDLISTTRLGQFQSEIPPPPYPAYGDVDFLAVGFNEQLIIQRLDQSAQASLETIDFPHRITRLCGSLPYRRGKLIVATEQGAFLMWSPGTRNPRPIPIAEHLNSPCIGLTRSGLLVALGDNGGEIYDTTNTKVKLLCRIDPPKTAPIAVLETGHDREFGVIFHDGNVHVYRVPN